MDMNLSSELSHYQYLRQSLAAQCPDADEETLLDTLEGMTDLNEMVAEVVRSRMDDLALGDALRARIRSMQSRLERLAERSETKKDIITTVLERAGIRKLVQEDFTLSLRPTTPGLVVVDESEVPPTFWKPQPPKLDRAGMLSTLKAGEAVPGATLANSKFTISVRTK